MKAADHGEYAIMQRIKGIISSIRDFFWKVYGRLRRKPGKRELIIMISAVTAVIVAVTLFIVLKTGRRDTAAALSGNAVSAADENNEGTSAGEDDAEPAPVVETATAGTKIESAEETTVLAKKEGAKEGYLNRCVFLGDSRTVAMVNYGFFNDDAALAQIGISHPSFEKNTFVNNAGKEYTMGSYLKSHQAPVIYIALGVNGINDPSEEHYKETFLTLIDKIADLAPNSNIVLMAIGPVDDNGAYKKTVQNEWIDKYNTFLLDTAKEKHIFYLDITEILKGDNGQVKPEYDAGDGLHYSKSGCEALFNYIVEHPVPGISDEGEYTVKYIKPDPNRTKVTMDDSSGIDEDKLKDLMKMMNEATPAPAAEKTADPSADAQSIQEQIAKEEDRKKREQEEAERRAQEEASRQAEEAAREEKESHSDEEASKAEEEKKAEEASREEEAKKAEEAQKAEEAKKAEEASKAEEAKKAEESARAEEAKKAEEAAKAEEARKAEEAARAEEAKRAEEAAKAEEASKAEEARKAEEEAAKQAEAEEAARQAEEAKKAEGASRAEEESSQPAEEEKPQESESSGDSGEQGSEGGE